MVGWKESVDCAAAREAKVHGVAGWEEVRGWLYGIFTLSTHVEQLAQSVQWSIGHKTEPESAESSCSGGPCILALNRLGQCALG